MDDLHLQASSPGVTTEEKHNTLYYLLAGVIAIGLVVVLAIRFFMQNPVPSDFPVHYNEVDSLTKEVIANSAFDFKALEEKNTAQDVTGASQLVGEAVVKNQHSTKTMETLTAKTASLKLLMRDVSDTAVKQGGFDLITLLEQRNMHLSQMIMYQKQLFEPLLAHYQALAAGAQSQGLPDINAILSAIQTEGQAIGQLQFDIEKAYAEFIQKARINTNSPYQGADAIRASLSVTPTTVQPQIFLPSVAPSSPIVSATPSVSPAGPEPVIASPSAMPEPEATASPSAEPTTMP